MLKPSETQISDYRRAGAVRDKEWDRRTFAWIIERVKVQMGSRTNITGENELSAVG